MVPPPPQKCFVGGGGFTVHFRSTAAACVWGLPYLCACVCVCARARLLATCMCSQNVCSVFIHVSPMLLTLGLRWSPGSEFNIGDEHIDPALMLWHAFSRFYVIWVVRADVLSLPPRLLSARVAFPCVVGALVCDC